MADGSQISDNSSPPREVQWLRFVEKLASSTPPTAIHWLEFVHKLVRRIPPPQQFTVPEFDKYFVLILHDIMGNVEHAVYVVDVNSSSNIHKYSRPCLDPILLFCYPRDHRIFLIVGYKLYMLGGCFLNSSGMNWMKKMSIYDLREAFFSGTTIDLSEEHEAEMIRQGKRKSDEELEEQWKLELSGVLLDDKDDVEVDQEELDKKEEEEEENEWMDWESVENLETGPEMREAKRWPFGVVIGGYKICVFSSVLFIPKSELSYNEFSLITPNFEVYDTRKESWNELPEPLDYNKLDPEVFVSVKSYCVHLSSLIIQTNIGIYGINIDHPKPDWVKMDGSESIQKFPIKGMWAMVDKQFYNPLEVVQWCDLVSYPIAFKDSTDRESLIEKCRSGALCINDGCINLCSVRGGFEFLDTTPNLLVDIVRLDAEALKKYGSDLSGWKDIQSDKSFTFSLRSVPSTWMDVIGCFPLKGIEQDIKEAVDIGLDIVNKAALEHGAHSLNVFSPQFTYRRN